MHKTNNTKRLKYFKERSEDKMQPCKDVFKDVLKQINEDKEHCIRAVELDDTNKTADEVYDGWYGQHQLDYGEAVFQSLLSVIGMFEDRMASKTYEGEFETINGIEVMPIKDFIATLKIELVCKLSGNDDVT
jgi:hypothetical protein|tara:strand:+ start:3021 stop:3416 length:396 start_codon:yes stop_codon:yes gene_type:complete